MNRHVLVLNILAEDHLRDSFDRRIKQVFTGLTIPYDVVYLNELASVTGVTDYTHLLISGSTASATEERAWYPALTEIIRQCDQHRLSILGICFGHQFLARYFMGKAHVRPSPTPEIGWIQLTLKPNRLFTGLVNFKSAAFHYDEVFDLDDRFEIISASPRCGIHGFQLKDRPIWGIQFHPDFQFEDFPAFVERARQFVDNFESLHCDTPISAREFQQNDAIFRNWLA